MDVRCPHCHTPIRLSDDSSLSDIPCPSCGDRFGLLDGDGTLSHYDATRTIGHFELLEQLGAGAFALGCSGDRGVGAGASGRRRGADAGNRVA